MKPALSTASANAWAISTAMRSARSITESSSSEFGTRFATPQIFATSSTLSNVTSLASTSAFSPTGRAASPPVRRAMLRVSLDIGTRRAYCGNTPYSSTSRMISFDSSGEVSTPPSELTPPAWARLSTP